MHDIWVHLFVPSLPIVEKIVRPIIVYFFLVLVFRLSGKRELVQLNPFDLVVLLTISNTVQNAIIGDDNSLTGGMIGATSLVITNYLVVRDCVGYQSKGHGFFMEDGDMQRSSPITAEEIASSRHHYIALGHVHVWNDVSQGATRAFYCGTPAPLYSGDHSGWVAWVECIPGEALRVEQVIVK